MASKGRRFICAGDDHPQEEGEHDGEGEGDKQVFLPGEGGVHPVVLIIRGPQGNNNKDNDLQDADELQVVEKKLFAVGLGEIGGNSGHNEPLAGNSLHLKNIKPARRGQ